MDVNVMAALSSCQFKAETFYQVGKISEVNIVK